MSSNLTPLEVCERLIGPLERLAKIGRTQPKTPYTWRRQSKWRDAGDMLPRINRALLAHSDAHGLGLTADHLIRGASEAAIAEILAARQQVAA